MFNLFVTPWAEARQTPLCIEFPRQEYWSGLPFPSPGNLPIPGIELASPASPALAGGFFTASATWEALTEENNCYLHPPSKEGELLHC